jgi:hypothetical protein
VLRLLAALATVAVPLLCFGSLSQRERKVLDDALFIAGLNEDDLGYAKRPASDPYRLPINAMALDRPIAAADSLMDLHEGAQGTLAEALNAGCAAAFGDPVQPAASPTGTTRLPPNIPEKLRRPLGHLLSCISEANGRIRYALRDLSATERRDLIEGLPQVAVETDHVKFGFVKRPKPKLEEMLSLLKRVDLGVIRSAGVRLAAQVEGALPTWRTLGATVPMAGTLRFRVDGIAVELSGQTDDDHSSLNTGLCIDMGGRHRYTGRYGAGVGYASVLIDCGRGEFDVPDLSVGAGLLGIGLAYVMGDRSEFKGRSLCFGAGLAGFGALYCEGSTDVFQSKALTQGFGMFGCGVLLAAGGSGQFRGNLFAQGAARTQGFGWLIAQRGNDVFREGGLLETEGGHWSRGQGYAEGYGSAPGGLGLITNLGSDNVYVGEVGCQGAALAGGTGSFCDIGGHGTRAASAEAQGFASDGSSAFLFDLGGSDSFSVKGAACHGFGGRLSTAFLLARGGGDLFASGDGRPATAVGCGLSVVVDDGEGDSFAAEPGLSVQSGGLDSFAVFCAAGGVPKVLGEQGPVSRVGQGSAVLIETDGAHGNALAKALELPPEIGWLPDSKDPLKDAASNDPLLARAGLAALLRKPLEAGSGVAAALVGAKDPVVRRAALSLLARYPDAALATASELMAQGDENSRRTGIRLLARLGTPEALSHIGHSLESPSRGVVIEALIGLDGRVPAEFVEQVSRLRTSPDELVRAVATGISID